MTIINEDFRNYDQSSTTIFRTEKGKLRPPQSTLKQTMMMMEEEETKSIVYNEIIQASRLFQQDNGDRLFNKSGKNQPKSRNKVKHSGKSTIQTLEITATKTFDDDLKRKQL